MWLINWNPTRCADSIVDRQFYFIDTCLVGSVYVVLVTVYTRVTCVAWQHHIRITTAQPASEAAESSTAGRSLSINLSRIGRSLQLPSVSNSQPSTSSCEPNTMTTIPDDVIKTERRKHVKRQFKALRLTAAVVGLYVLLELPYMIGNMLRAGGNQSASVEYLYQVGSAIAMLYFAFNWIVYGLVSSKFRKGLIAVFKKPR